MPCVRGPGWPICNYYNYFYLHSQMTFTLSYVYDWHMLKSWFQPEEGLNPKIPSKKKLPTAGRQPTGPQ